MAYTVVFCLTFWLQSLSDDSMDFTSKRSQRADAKKAKEDSTPWWMREDDDSSVKTGRGRKKSNDDDPPASTPSIYAVY